MSMYYYFGYGLRIRSELRLPGFVERTAGPEADVEITLGPVALERWEQLNDDGMKLAGMADGVMRFYVAEGQHITVDVLPGADREYAQAIVSGELMAALLRQRGLLALHGSCVARDGAAIGFIGNSGWGKSTLAMHFVEQGYRLLCDDVLAVSFAGGRPAAVPGYPQVKLRPDSGARYASDTYEDLARAHSETDKRLYNCPADFQDTAVPLRKLYVLEPVGRSASRVAEFSYPAAFAELVGHTRGTKLIKHREFVLAHFAQTTELLKAVPTSLLHRRMDLDLLPELYDLVERDLDASAPVARGVLS